MGISLRNGQPQNGETRRRKALDELTARDQEFGRQQAMAPPAAVLEAAVRTSKPTEP